MLWKCYCRREAKKLEQEGKVNRFQTFQDQILGEGHYSEPQNQACSNKHTLSLCGTAAINAWGRIQKPGKRIKSYIRVKQGQREHFSDFLQTLSKAIKVGVTDPEARYILIKTLTFENVNLEYKKILGCLPVTSAPIDEWILHTINVETFDWNTKTRVGKGISNGMRRYHNVKYFNCCRTEQLRSKFK